MNQILQFSFPLWYQILSHVQQWLPLSASVFPSQPMVAFHFTELGVADPSIVALRCPLHPYEGKWRRPFVIPPPLLFDLFKGRERIIKKKGEIQLVDTEDAAHKNSPPFFLWFYRFFQRVGGKYRKAFFLIRFVIRFQLCSGFVLVSF